MMAHETPTTEDGDSFPVVKGGRRLRGLPKELEQETEGLREIVRPFTWRAGTSFTDTD